MLSYLGLFTVEINGLPITAYVKCAAQLFGGLSKQ
jgi:hypothetical protein